MHDLMRIISDQSRCIQLVKKYIQILLHMSER